MSTIKVDHIRPFANVDTVTFSGDIYCENLSVADFIMSNDRIHHQGNDIDGTKGSWVFQEGENNIFLINKKNGKKYKLVLEEI